MSMSMSAQSMFISGVCARRSIVAMPAIRSERFAVPAIPLTINLPQLSRAEYDLLLSSWHKKALNRGPFTYEQVY